MGGYGAFRELNADDKAVLEAAFKKFAGATYEALLTSTQVVAGLNYRFAGTQTLVTKGAPAYPVLFTVHQPHSGGPPSLPARKRCMSWCEGDCADVR